MLVYSALDKSGNKVFVVGLVGLLVLSTIAQPVDAVDDFIRTNAGLKPVVTVGPDAEPLPVYDPMDE